MRLGTILGDGQEAVYEAARRSEREAEKAERKRQEAERNRKRSRGELIRYTEREK